MGYGEGGDGATPLARKTLRPPNQTGETMKIRIGDYLVHGHKGDWAVREVKISKSGESKGEEYLAGGDFFGRLYQALFFVLNCRIGESDKVSIAKLRKLINEHCIEIKEIADKMEQE